MFRESGAINRNSESEVVSFRVRKSIKKILEKTLGQGYTKEGL